jgi:hypothetical protein
MNTGKKRLILALLSFYLVIGGVTAAGVQVSNASNASYMISSDSSTGASLSSDIPLSLPESIASISKADLSGEFMTLALDLKDRGSLKKVTKWARASVAVKVTGKPDEQSMQCLADAVTEIDNLTGLVSLRVSESGTPGIEMNFIPLDEFSHQIRGYVAGSEGYTSCKSTSGLLQKCTIWVPTTGVSGDLRCTIIRHELTHGLGLFGHSNHPESIMYQGTTATDYSSLDRDVIRLLYNDRIFPGSSEETVRAYLSE